LHDERGRQRDASASQLPAAGYNGCGPCHVTLDLARAAARHGRVGHDGRLIDSVATFEDVWRTVRDRFYDPDLHGLNWSAVRERYLPEAAGATSGTALAKAINRMLSELRASHTQYYTPDEPEYYQLVVKIRHLSLAQVRVPGVFVDF
jgi:hypothetical protein